MWSIFDDDKYTDLKIDNHLCLQQDGVQIYGEEGNQNFMYIYLKMEICQNSTNSSVVCASSTEIDDFFAGNLHIGRSVGCSLYILDTGVNPTDDNPLAYNIYEESLWLLANQ